MVWQKNGTPDTLTVAGDTVTISDLTPTKSNVFLSNMIKDGAGPETKHRVGNSSIDSGSNYATRTNLNGGSDFTNVNRDSMEPEDGSNYDNSFLVHYAVNISTEEKLFIFPQEVRSNVGAGVAPVRSEAVGKWSNTSSQFDQAQLLNVDAGSFGIDTNLSALGDVVAAPATVGGWVEIGRDTLGIAGDTIDVSSLADKRYLMILHHAIATGGSVVSSERYNADSGSVYSGRFSVNGAADGTEVSQTGMQDVGITTGLESFQVEYVGNLAAEEKLSIKQMGDNSTGTGAANAPRRIQRVNKWAETTNPIDQVQNINADTGDFAIGSETVVLGWDPSDVHTTNFWEELTVKQEGSDTSTPFTTATFATKKYLWIQMYIDTSAAVEFRVGAGGTIDTGTSYSLTTSNNGGAEETKVNQVHLNTPTSKGFVNMFIVNNSANEKLFIYQLTDAAVTGAANVPNRREYVGKWTNTSGQINIVQLYSTGVTFSSNSFIKVWGAD